ncbi:hypothetical protein EH165_09455 [Nakamurella antarctica]|uniref:Phospholipase A2 n=1 Tax=Nakamurella antarctica TaxID=1902245 RepID=A0A3G8ZXE8_9ACTN|nr:hypothetical protein [Nakamurella antarctica]AZI58331.1 hypothetical protein EH165_09455 [Nakamurella antarctica]
MWRRLIPATVAFALSFGVLGVRMPDTEAVADPGVQRALDAVTAQSFDPANPNSAFPTDFADVMGYHAAVGRNSDGSLILYKPTGDCSSFAGQTEYDFDVVCKQHDLAYDVLRYSERVGEALPAAARAQADAMFMAALHQRCTYSDLAGMSLVTCHLMAESFGWTVDFNSWRQGFRPPSLGESTWDWAAIFALTLLLLVVREVQKRWRLATSSPLCDIATKSSWVAVSAPQARQAPPVGARKDTVLTG